MDLLVDGAQEMCLCIMLSILALESVTELKRLHLFPLNNSVPIYIIFLNAPCVAFSRKKTFV